MSAPRQWINDIIEQHCEVFGNIAYDEEYFSPAREFAKALGKDHLTSFELISTFNQSSFTSMHKGDSVVFFDVAQSQLLKNVFLKISQHDDFFAVAETLKRAGCLFILPRDFHFSSLAFKHTLIPFENYYRIDEEKIERYNSYIQPHKHYFATRQFFQLLDNFIIGHELFHLLKGNGYLGNVDHSYSAMLFERALEQCCYEDQPNFEEIASYYNELEIDEKGFEKIRKDLVNRRAHYLATKNSLREEIECDYFSFQILINYFFSKDPTSIDQHIDFAFTFFFIFSVFDLHFAMNRRFLLSERSGVDELKPGGIADMNFRKVALLESMIGYIFKRSDFLQYAGEKKLIKTAEEYRQGIFEFKKAIDGLYMMPVTLAIESILRNTEKMKSIIPPKEIKEHHIQSLIDLIINSDAMFDQAEVDKAYGHR